MKVVYVSTLDRGGPLSHVRDLAPAVAAQGVDVKVVCASPALAAEFAAMGLEAASLPLRHKLDARGAARVWRHLEGADVVHTHDRRGGLLVRPQAAAQGARVVHTFHGVPDEIFVRVGRSTAPTPPGVSSARLAWLLHGLLRIEALLSYFGHVVVPSQALADFLLEHGFPAKRLSVIPYGIVVRRRDPGPARRPLALGCAAILEYRKGLDVLLEACAQTQAPVRLELFGEGSERTRLEAHGRRLGVDAHFHGFVDDLRERLDDIDVFVLPTRADNLPVAIMEAMAAALPVVATRVGGVTELVEDGLTGLVVEPDDADALAAAIDALAGDESRRQELGREGARRASELFDAEDVARRIVELYDGLCGFST